eukprot:gene11021-3091_t
MTLKSGCAQHVQRHTCAYARIDTHAQIARHTMVDMSCGAGCAIVVAVAWLWKTMYGVGRGGCRWGLGCAVLCCAVLCWRQRLPPPRRGGCGCGCGFGRRGGDGLGWALFGPMLSWSVLVSAAGSSCSYHDRCRSRTRVVEMQVAFFAFWSARKKFS